MHALFIICLIVVTSFLASHPCGCLRLSSCVSPVFNYLRLPLCLWLCPKSLTSIHFTVSSPFSSVVFSLCHFVCSASCDVSSSVHVHIFSTAFSPSVCFLPFLELGVLSHQRPSTMLPALFLWLLTHLASLPTYVCIWVPAYPKHNTQPHRHFSMWINPKLARPSGSSDTSFDRLFGDGLLRGQLQKK